MGCCSSKTIVSEPVVRKLPEDPNSNNILDSPFSKSLVRERDGTLTLGQIPKEVANAYDKLLEDQNYININESFHENPVRVNPYMEPWKETEVKPSKYLVLDKKYYKPPVTDPQPQYLLDMQQDLLTLLDTHSNQTSAQQNKIFSQAARAIFVPKLDTILICGGKSHPRSTYSVNPATGHIQTQDNLFEGREYHSLAYVDEIVMATGGMGYEELSSCEIYFRGRWSSTGSLNKARSMHSSIGLEKCVYVCGGMKQSSIEKWLEGRWVVLGISLAASIGRLGIAPVSAFSFLVVGGERSGLEYSGSVWEVDVNRFQISQIAGIQKIGLFESCGCYLDETCVLYMGGCRYTYFISQKAWEYSN